MIWPMQQLSELGTVHTGWTPSTAENQFWSGDIPFVTPGDLDQDNAVVTTPRTLSEVGAGQTKLLLEGAVMVCCIGSLGKIGIAGCALATNQQINSIQFDPSVIWPKFGYYACQLLRKTLQTIAPATTVPIVSKSKFSQLKIPVPPISAQRRIAAILDQADALRTYRRETLAQLDKFTQAIFVEMFGDPSTNSKGWCIREIGDLLFSATYGTSEKSSDSGQFPVLRMNNLTRTGEIDLSELKYMDLDRKDFDRYFVKSGDILFNRTNSAELVGKTAVYRHTEPVAYAGYLIRLRANAENDPEYIASFLNSPYAKRMLRAMCKSIIGMANINATEVQAMKIAQPPLALQQQFARRVHAIEKQKTVFRQSLAHLNELFASLQHRAFRGEL